MSIERENIMEELLINKVADSGIVSLDLETFFPTEAIQVFDLKGFLFMELILKEKDFRDRLKHFDWTPFEGKVAAVCCSADAIVPVWAYMLAAAYLQPVALQVVFGNVEQVQTKLLLRKIRQIHAQDFADKRVVVKGCGDLHIGEEAYLEIAQILRPVVKSMMYGEPCSTVPIFKQSVAR